ncbi:C4-dicarboxylate TRAP transporter substrate-binding protein [Oceanicella sp. SM1341]|uniref:C4-dicarboxylate TRAP transporter substrate-binding protein n=1 Tax=Oceanicella sp. SM1341 TaxID=1548889 RepID=UPI0013002E29|nr:C4-dicarboxylate TRAP transporter substrate-binding protein [Oceanicella sp. SM1341]
MSLRRFLPALAPGLLAAGLSAPGALADTTLTYGSSLPAPHIVHTAGLEPFFARVEAATGGDTGWELSPGGAMGGVKEAFSMVADNVTDAGLLLDIYARQELPVTSMFSDMITLPDDFIVFAAAANEMQLVACEECIAERSARDVVSLAYYGPDPYLIMCRDDTRSLADLQNKKTRASGRLGVLMQDFGATTVTIPSSEVYESLQRGQADCTVASTAWLESYALKDVVKTVIDLPTGSYFNAGLMLMNKPVFDGLSEAGQQAIRANLAELVVDVLFAYRDEGRAALDSAVAAGVTLVEPDEEMLERIGAFRAGEIENTIAAADAAGVPGARQRIETYMALVEKWRGLLAGIGDDKQAFVDALNREVFDKARF